MAANTLSARLVLDMGDFSSKLNQAENSVKNFANNVKSSISGNFGSQNIKIDTNLDSLNSEVEQYKSKLESVTAEISQWKSNISSLAVEQQRANAEISSAKTAVSAVKEEQSEFNLKIQSSKKLTEQQKSAQEALNGKLTEAKSRLEKAKSAQQNVTTKINEAKSALGNAKAKQIELNNQIEQGKSKINAEKAAQDKLNNAIDTGTAKKAKSARTSQSSTSVSGDVSGGNSLAGLASGIKNTAIAAAVVKGVETAAKGIYSLTDMASDLYETNSKVEVSFGDSADSVKQWAQTSTTSMGLAKQTALDMAAYFGDMGTSMGIPQDEAANMSTSLTQLAADLASFKNTDIDQVQTGLKGVFTGETESIKELGVVMTQTNLEQYAMSQGITKSISDMTEAEKVQLRYNYVLAKTTNAQGDYVRTGGGFANQQRTLKENFKELGTTIGEFLLPTMTSGVKSLNELTTDITSVFEDGFQLEDITSISDKITNWLSDGIDNAIDNLPGAIDMGYKFLHQCYTSISESAKELIPKVGTLLGETLKSVALHIPENIFSGIEFGGNLLVGIINGVNEVLKAIPGIISNLITGFVEGLPGFIETGSDIMFQIKDGLTETTDILSTLGGDIFDAICEAVSEIDWDTVGSEIWEALKESLVNHAASFNVSDLFSLGKKGSKMFGGSSGSLLFSLGEDLYDVYKDYTAEPSKNVANDPLAEASGVFGSDTSDPLKKTEAPETLSSKISTMWDNANKTASEKMNTLKTLSASKWNEIKTGTSTALDNVKTTISAKWNEVKTNTSAAWQNIKTSATNAAENLKTVVSGKWDNIKTSTSDKWNEICTSIAAWWENIKTGTSAKIEDLRISIAEKFGSLKETIVSPFQTAYEGIQQALDNIKNAVSTAWQTIKDSIKTPTIKQIGTVEIAGISTPVPKLGIEWNAAGGIFTKPTVLPTSAGIQGFGEAGAEAILPLKSFWDNLHKFVAEAYGTEQTNNSNAQNKNTINIYVDAKDKSADEIIGDIISPLKLALSNI